MNRMIVSAFIAIAAIAGNTADCNAATISKGKTKKVSTFFSKVLEGEKTVYKGTDKIAPENIEATRNAVWECWRNAVENKDPFSRSIISMFWTVRGPFLFHFQNISASQVLCFLEVPQGTPTIWQK